MIDQASDPKAQAPALPPGPQAFALDPVTVDTLPSSAAINLGTFDEKTLSVSFETGADVQSRQVIYEQGAGGRGLNVFVDGGKVYLAAWNYNEENWGYKEISADIDADTAYTATLVMDGAYPANGTLEGYLNGVPIGEVGGVGLLYEHSGDVGIGEARFSTTLHDVAFDGDGLAFDGSIGKAVSYNEALTGADLRQVHEHMAYGWLGQEDVAAPTLGSLAFALDPVTVDTLPSSAAINLGTFDEKTLSVSFETGADVQSRQVIYEQGAGGRGLNVFVDGGKVYLAAWNYNEENWGYKEISADIDADTAYTATLVMDGAYPANGTLEGYLNGVPIGEVGGVGLLYEHSGDVGIGEARFSTTLHDVAFDGDGLAFDGSIGKAVSYNEALTGADLGRLHGFMAHDWLGTASAAGDGPPPPPHGEPVLYFSADDGTSGRELWATDGTSVFPIADVAPGAAGSNPEHITPFAGGVFFTADNGVTGREAYIHDGTSVIALGDLNPGAADSNPGKAVAVNGTLYFAADTGSDHSVLFAHDGMTTTQVGAFDPAVHDPVEALAASDGTVLIATEALDTVSMFSLDGAGVTELFSATDFTDGLSFERFFEVGDRSFASTLSFRNETIYEFEGDDLVLFDSGLGFGRIVELQGELLGEISFWTDPPKIGPVGDSNGQFPHPVEHEHDGERILDVTSEGLFFARFHHGPASDIELFDGTALHEVPAPSSGAIDDHGLGAATVVLDDRLLLDWRVEDGTDDGQGYLIGGDGLGLRALPSTDGSLDYDPDALTVAGGALLFTAVDASGDRELWINGPSGPVELADIDPAGSSDPMRLPAVPYDRLFA